MSGESSVVASSAPAHQAILPALIVHAGDRASERFVEFFTATIRNANTRFAYARAVAHFLLWCEHRGLALHDIRPVIVAAYIEQHTSAPPSVKQALAAIRRLFDWLVTGQIMPSNPAASVRGPTYVVKTGKTPVLTADQARLLLDSIDIGRVIGLRDRALIAVMCYTFARVGAAVRMRVEDYYPNGKRWWVRLHEKGGKMHAVPAHHNLELYLDEYLKKAGIAGDSKGCLFRTIARKHALTDRPMSANDVLRMVKRRAISAGLPHSTCCHTFRATGITAFLANGGSISNAQTIAAHESPRTTKLYDRTGDQITLNEIERILI